MALRKYSIVRMVMHEIFWHLVPGVDLCVKWPAGKLIVTPDDPGWDWTLGAHYQEYFSADPNDHYRPWLEKHVGVQSWDWDWALTNTDLNDNTLTIRFRKKHAKLATVAGLRWT